MEEADWRKSADTQHEIRKPVEKSIVLEVDSDDDDHDTDVVVEHGGKEDERVGIATQEPVMGGVKGDTTKESNKGGEKGVAQQVSN